jgi:response regulator of citrate/malate metabolism
MRESIDNETVLGEIIKLSSCYRGRRPDAEITAKEYARARNISVKRARSALNNLVEQGELVSELVLNNGNPTRVWWPVDS